MPLSLNFDQMLNGLQHYVANVQNYLSVLEQSASTGGSVNIGVMFQLQFKMQIMSQFLEAVSNSLSAVHQEMITMARATKGS